MTEPDPATTRRRGRLPVILGAVVAVAVLVALVVALSSRDDEPSDDLPAGAAGADAGDHGEAEDTSPEGQAPAGADPGRSPAEDGPGSGDEDPPPPQEWQAAIDLTDPIAQGVAAVSARPEEGVEAYRAAVREAVPATGDVPDALLDDYPETICVVAEQEPSAVPDVIEALRTSGQIDPDVASFLTAAAVAASCPEHLDALPS